MTTPQFRPLSDRILVQRTVAADKTESGIIIPENAKEKPAEGKILAVGPGRITDEGRLVEPRVKAGDMVLFGKYSGTEVKVDGADCIVMREDDLLGVLEG